MKRVNIVFDNETIPVALREYIQQASVYDSSCSEAARTLYVEGQDKKMYLKIAKDGQLRREGLMSDFLHGQGLAPKVIAYEHDGVNDYLLTEALEGEDGVSGGHLDDPGKLAAVFGESLRYLHSLSTKHCPFQERTAEILLEFQDTIMNKDAGDLRGFPGGRDQALSQLEKLREAAAHDVLIHGDYCLPNIILNDFKLHGFIDLGSGGVGDRHYDLYWGIWTLRYNMKSDDYKGVFLDHYGRADIDAERLALWSALIELN